MINYTGDLDRTMDNILWHAAGSVDSNMKKSDKITLPYFSGILQEYEVVAVYKVFHGGTLYFLQSSYQLHYDITWY